jgi:hypothetical protein
MYEYLRDVLGTRRKPDILSREKERWHLAL